MAESNDVHTSAFEHTPLRNPMHTIRLLRLTPQDSANLNGQDVAIHCDLTTWPLDEAPAYVAVSYTWGDPMHSKTVRLNNKAFTVRQSCWYVLAQAQQNCITGYLWIDAVCINQGDDAEKSAQVARMGDIYRNAMQINVCLGPHEKDSAICFETAEQYIDCANNLLRRAKDDGTMREMLLHMENRGQEALAMAESYGDVKLHNFSRRVRAELQGDLQTRRFFHSHSAAQLDRLTEAFYAITERSYFERLWIVQELLLARKAIVFCGDSALDFQDLADFQLSLSTYCSDQRSSGSSQEYRQIDSTTSRGFSSIDNVWHGWSGAGMGLVELTDYFAHFKCYDARDKIYGLLALVDWKALPPLLPDYSKSALAVALQAIDYMCSCPQEGGAITPDRDSGPASYETLSHADWPIVSVTQIAAGLGLHSQSPDVQLRLQQRRNQRDAIASATMRVTADKSERRLSVQVDSFCQLFRSKTGDDALEACIVQRKRFTAMESDTPPGFERQPGPNFGEVAYRDVLGSTGACLKVARWAQPGDYVISFHSSGFDPALVIRGAKDGSGCYRIIGQAIFDDETVICSGTESCHCTCDAAWHSSLYIEMTAYFVPEDLLLFVCQSLVPHDSRSMDIVRFQEVEAGGRVREAHVTQVGDIVEDSRLLPPRLATSVVQPDHCYSSFVEVEASSGDRALEGLDEEHAQLSEQLRNLVYTLNERRK